MNSLYHNLMPHIGELIDQLGQAKYVTTLDLTRGYWQVLIGRKCKGKDGICTSIPRSYRTPNFATIATPLTDLIRKKQPNQVVWTPACSKAFEELKKHLCSDPVLRSPDFNRPFKLQTDASNRGVGEVLSQTDAEGEEHLVAYFSQKLLEREEKYSTIGKKCLVIKFAIQAFQVYVYLLHVGKLFTIQTDHLEMVRST